MDINSRWFFPNMKHGLVHVFYGCDDHEMGDILETESIFPRIDRGRNGYPIFSTIYDDFSDCPSVLSFVVPNTSSAKGWLRPINSTELVSLGPLYLTEYKSIRLHRLKNVNMTPWFIDRCDKSTARRMFGDIKPMLNQILKYIDKKEDFPLFTCTLPF